MKPRYSLRKTLYRDAPRIDQFRMSGATAQKIRVAGLESVIVGGVMVRVTAYGWDMK